MFIYQTSFHVVFKWLIDILIHSWLKQNYVVLFAKSKSKQHFDTGDIYRSSDRKYKKNTWRKTEFMFIKALHAGFYYSMVFCSNTWEIYCFTSAFDTSTKHLIFFWRFSGPIRYKINTFLYRDRPPSECNTYQQAWKLRIEILMKKTYTKATEGRKHVS